MDTTSLSAFDFLISAPSCATNQSQRIRCVLIATPQRHLHVLLLTFNYISVDTLIVIVAAL